MKNMLFFTNLFFLVFFVSQSYSMETEKKPIISNSFLKYLFIGLSTGGTLTLACNAYQDMQQIAEDKHHTDPESEAALAFVAATTIGYCVSRFVYNFWFNPTKKQTANIPLQIQPKKKHKTIYQKNFQKAVKLANSKHDKATRKNSKLRNF
jgi:hypothetical protein